MFSSGSLNQKVSAAKGEASTMYCVTLGAIALDF
jgi:hypothetical protein